MKTSNRESAVVHVVDQKLLNWKGLEQVVKLLSYILFYGSH